MTRYGHLDHYCVFRELLSNASVPLPGVLSNLQTLNLHQHPRYTSGLGKPDYWPLARFGRRQTNLKPKTFPIRQNPFPAENSHTNYQAKQGFLPAPSGRVRKTIVGHSHGYRNRIWPTQRIGHTARSPTSSSSSSVVGFEWALGDRSSAHYGEQVDRLVEICGVGFGVHLSVVVSGKWPRPYAGDPSGRPHIDAGPLGRRPMHEYSTHDVLRLATRARRSNRGRVLPTWLS
jgi:hypothetical protein